MGRGHRIDRKGGQSEQERAGHDTIGAGALRPDRYGRTDDRGNSRGPSYLPQLQQDILKVIRKYVQVEQDAVSVNVERDASHEILELNIVLPETQR